MNRNTTTATSSLADYDTHHKFKNEILNGLSEEPKHLLSKYFYDKKGDELFQQIMNMPEYYLTDCELEIFTRKKNEIAKAIRAFDEPFDLVELGAGDATKSLYLLEYLVAQNADFTYMPIDISANIISILEENLTSKVPELQMTGLNGEYFEMLDKANEISSRRKVILFLGGNIGNMEIEEAYEFCNALKSKLNPNDILLIGFDLKKNPHTILAAYNDKEGITSSFNLNLLTRINEELEADFNIDHFSHYQTYDPLSGACRSYLISLEDQKVHIDDQEISFKANEAVYMEISQKYSEKEIDIMARKTGFKPLKQISDNKGWFVDAIWKI
ncbi:L-histidine N(alpha)-methyltransferase [Chryseobacterium gambrini]|uniref:L-histidine N(Alpha)-methyltransferase n=1 Tax=Chryseobacterium gambrini TaxID=373672 RepID=A0AAJ1R0M5_9FLAO|nr:MULTISPECIES: L-histidine N(alpha)-methyltransferase [Chryseobacterium]MDN4011092.1 L-histidine N(alpha)-methyltransferase [Chryseobacterium gambrini]MDN4028325.1 L-histidine N(alpha)-methyltransferase [Chryseobacterium gambrini]QWA38736.1 L-histidine N(alpha)-methyltransferase [Chryseobacterium sp. ZHDP1]